MRRVAGVLALFSFVTVAGLSSVAAQDSSTDVLWPLEGLFAATEGRDVLSLSKGPPITPGLSGERTDVLGAFSDSLRLLLIEHGTRIAFQEKTRRELKNGPFWREYTQSVRVPHQWEDSDAWWVNYIGHPIHGAAAGYIWLDHGSEPAHQIGLNRRYWIQRAYATAWSAGYSLQFEIGPLSEASIGNVGMRPETTGWVDYAVTPAGAFGLMVAEDILDRYFVQLIERHTTNRVWRASLRLLFNPARTLSNTAGGHLPWHRDGRPLGWR